MCQLNNLDKAVWSGYFNRGRLKLTPGFELKAEQNNVQW